MMVVVVMVVTDYHQIHDHPLCYLGRFSDRSRGGPSSPPMGRNPVVDVAVEVDCALWWQMTAMSNFS